jgi:hypothetical protein
MPNPFKDPDEKKFNDECACDCDHAAVTKKDLRKMESRLTAILGVIASGDKERIKILTDQLKNSATDLQDAVNKNKP